MPKIQTRVMIDENHLNWLTKMKCEGVGKSDIINLALSVIRPRLVNIETSDERIKEVLLTKNENLEY